MNKGIFYMLTATEVQHIRGVIHEFLDIIPSDDISDSLNEDARDALDLLSKVKPIDTEEALTVIAEQNETVEIQEEEQAESDK